MKCRSPLASGLALSLALLVPITALADAPTSLSPGRIKLPSGPGSLEGVGENAEPQLNQAAVGYGVSIELPSGYAGISPSLNLSYSNTSGSGPVGIGWALPASAIERMTARGLPVYTGADELVGADGGELVRVGGTEQARVYRSRFEGSFARTTWVDATGDGTGGYFVVEFPNGTRGYFGATADGVIVPEARLEGEGGTFRYMLVEHVDVFDHRVRYSYRLSGGVPLLEWIGWVFDGGLANAPRYEALITYEPRPDILSDAKSGREAVLSERVADIQVLVGGQQVRRYALGYEDASTSGGLSRLSSVATYGVDDQGPYPAQFSFEYTQAFDLTCSSPGCAPPTAYDLGSAGLDFRTGDAALIDMNGDGLPDVVDTRGGAHSVALQTIQEDGIQRLSPATASMYSNAGAMALSSPEVQRLDVNGDGRMDLVDRLNGQVLYADGSGDWGLLEDVDTGLPSFAADQDLRFFDYDYDRAIDVVHLSRAGAWVYRNRGDGTFESAQLIEGIGLGFTEDGLKLADMNGDGLLDLVRVTADAVTLWLHLGFGRFTTAREMFFFEPVSTPEAIELTDVNGDGLADAVRVAGTEVIFALSVAGNEFGPELVLSGANVVGGLPEKTSEVSFQLVDMNGSGSADLVYSDPSGAITFVELFGERPNLLREVRNGLGRVIRFGYGSSVSHMSRDGGPDAWLYRLPHPMQTLDFIESIDELTGNVEFQTFHYRNGYYDGEEHQFRGFADVEVFSVGDDSIERGHRVHHFDVGATDRYRKGLTLTVEESSAGRILSRTQSSYADCDVEGVTAPQVRFICPTSTRTTLIEGRPESEWTTLEVRHEHDGFGNRIRTENLGVVGTGPDGTAECAPCQHTDGLVGGACGPSCEGDELFQTSFFVHPDQTGGLWLLRAPYQTRSFSDPSGLVSETRIYYDGEDFVGLPIAHLTRGVAVRTSQSLDGRWVDVDRRAVGAHGEVLEVRDAEDHGRSFTYDGAGLLVRSESILFDDPEVRASVGTGAYELRMEVDYDPILEEVTAATSWMRAPIGGDAETGRRETQYAYDAFGRLTSIAYPGDDPATPSQEFAYELGTPVSRIVARQRTVVGGTLDLVSVQCLDGFGRRVEERARVREGEWLVSNRTRFNVQGKPSRLYQPYTAATGACGEVEPEGVPYGETRFDAPGRIVSTTAPDASIYGSPSVGRIEYRPLRTLTSDVEDTDPNSLNHETPTESVVDGLGRAVAVTRVLVTPALDETLGLLGPTTQTADGAPQTLTAQLRYDSLGRVRSVIDPAGHVRSQTLDLLGRVIEIEDPDSGLTQMRYDDAGRLLSRIDARGAETQMAYDEAGRSIATWDPAAPDETEVTWSYDGLSAACATRTGGCDMHPGSLTELTHPLLDGERASESIGYDLRGQIVESVVRRGEDVYQFTSQYDNAGRQVAATMPAGITIEQHLDGLGRVTEIPGVVNEITYTQRGRVENVSLANGTSTQHQYDALGRLTALSSWLPTGTALLDARYALSRTGQILAVEDFAPGDARGVNASARYAYDSLHRLVQAHLSPDTNAEEIVTYDYDIVDNLTRKVSSRLGLSPVHLGELRYGEEGAGPFQLTSLGHGLPSAALETWRYDAAGNVVEQGRNRHEWDFLGRLVRSEVPSTSASDSEYEAVAYAYGPDGARTQKRERGHFTEYIADGFEVRDGIATAYVDVPGVPTIRIERPVLAATLMVDADDDGIITAGDAVVVLDGSTLSESERTKAERYPVDRMLAASARRMLLEGEPYTVLHENHLGTTIGETDASGALLSRQSAYPYGHPRTFDGAVPERWFTGQERDQASGLSYHSARYLDLRVGRWISPDPLFAAPGELSRSALNRYAYTQNSPIVSIDPSGLDGWSTLRAFGEGMLEGAGSAAGGIVDAVTHPVETARGVVTAAVDTGRAAARAATDAGYRAELVQRGMASARETVEFVRNASPEELARAGGRLAGEAAVSAAVGAATGGAVAVGVRVGAGAVRIGRVARVVRPRPHAVPRPSSAPRMDVDLPDLPCPAGRVGCFAAGTLIAIAATDAGIAIAGAKVPIEEIRVGMRVSTTSGLDDSAVDETWQVHDAELIPSSDPDHVVHLTLLRPASWLERRDSDGDGHFWMELPELALEGVVRVVRSRGPPAIADGPGRVVLTVLRREVPSALRLHFEGAPAPIVVTANHPVFSADRGDWAPVAELRLGERVETDTGAARLIRVEDLEGPLVVWNLEVEGDHEYLVGEHGLRVHNTGRLPCVGGGGAAEPYDRRQHFGDPSRSPEARRIRREAEGQPCPSCGETMQSGDSRRAPTAQHEPALVEVYDAGGAGRTPAERRAYARSPEAFDGALCRSCNSADGARRAHQRRAAQSGD